MNNDTSKLNYTDKKQETAVLVALTTPKQPLQKTKEYLDELAFLAETSGVKTLQSFTQKLDKPDYRTFVGKGKMEEIAAFVRDKAVDMVIFDDDLSPSQVRNLETELQCKILDRSLLILNIFSIRAQTSQAKTQVELAQYQYLLPRLTRMWSHLSKQKGGIGMRGPGEKELETDRRIVRDKISLLREKLDKIEKQGFTQRKSRDAMVRVALVGYTNVGKSTLMRLLSKSDVFAENKLFATVDSTVRKVVYNQIPFLLTDTVGFIRKLPTTLIESFKSTLDEIREADLLLHVVDASHPSYEEQIGIVKSTLAEIGAADKSTILVFNKIDLLKAYPENELTDGQGEIVEVMPIDKLKATHMNQQDTATVFISAEKGQNIDDLRDVLFDKVSQIHYTIFPNYLKDQVFSANSSSNGKAQDNDSI
jgi:GTP-binding protein HflX